MKRLWLGIGILAAILALCCTVTLSMECIHTPIAEDLSRAAEAAQKEDWDKANALAAAAKARWEQYWHFTAMVADHTPMDELDGLFAELEVYGREQEMPHFAATCAHLCRLSQAMADSHTPSWWNLI